MDEKFQNRREFFKTIGGMGATLLMHAPLSALVSTSRKKTPNIILVFVDDLGYGDLGCYGNDTIDTTHIDALAGNGKRFTDFYASSAWCIPSRAGLLTGIHPYRSGMEWENLGAKTTLAEMLKGRGYSTAILGKWHLGLRKGAHPLDQGFDYFYGTPGSNDVPAPEGKSQNYDVFQTAKEEDWPVPMIRNRERVELPAKQSLFTKRYTEESIRIIKESGEKPFFLYLSHNMPHVPLFASEKFRGKSKAGIYGDVIEELDWSVGEIVKALKQEGLIDDTLLIFTSDNGPWTMFKEFGGTAAPLRGEKGTGWEGGVRVPAIFYWPGRIDPGVTSAFMLNIDIYATLAAIAGAKLPTAYKLDSLDMSGVLLRGKESPRKSFLFFTGDHGDKPFAYRSGDFKIHFRTNEMLRDPITGEEVPVTKHDPPLLFNLKKDPGERTNIAEYEPEVLQRMIAEFRSAVQELTGKDRAR